MYPFTRVHPYETQEIILNDILKHFREVSGPGGLGGVPLGDSGWRRCCCSVCRS